MSRIRRLRIKRAGLLVILSGIFFVGFQNCSKSLRSSSNAQEGRGANPSSSVAWSAEKSLFKPGPSSAFGNFGKEIAVDGSGYINVAWMQSPAGTGAGDAFIYSGTGSLHFAQSGDKGATWTNSPLTSSYQIVSLPKIATASGNIYVVYPAVETASTALKILFLHGVRSADQVQWSSPKVISDAPVGHNATFPVIAANGDHVYMAWIDDRASGAQEVYFTRSEDLGSDWSVPVAISPVDGFNSWTPSIAASSTSVHIAWTDGRFGQTDCTTKPEDCHEVIYYRKSADAGVNWDPEVQLTCDASIYTFAPSLEVENNSVHIAYFQGNPFPPGAMDLYYMRSNNNGDSFQKCAGTQGTLARIPVQYPSGDQVLTAWRPNIAVHKGVVHMVWWGELTNDYAVGQSKIYYSRSTDGLHWENATSLTPQSGASYRAFSPNIALSQDGADIFTIWEDHRDDLQPLNADFQVYFRSGKQN